MIPIINKPTRFIKRTAIAIDHISINSVTTTKFKTGIIKSDVFDHFPILFIAGCIIHKKETKEHYIFRRDLSDVSVEIFKYKLRTVRSGSITNSCDRDNAYDIFIEIFSSLYEECFLRYSAPRVISNTILKNSNMSLLLLKTFFFITDLSLKLSSSLGTTEIYPG